ncbi:MAG: tetratricopeptide repeat protein [Rhodothermales bacterium]
MNGSIRYVHGWVAILLAALGLLAASCAPPGPIFGEDIEDYEEAIADLQAQVGRNPSDAQALRDLGVIYLRTNNFGRANEFLEMAFARDPDDPKTLFHLGLANESVGKHDTALRLYERYPEFSILSSYRRLMAGRYAWVIRKKMNDEVQARVADEARLVGDRLEPRVVAIYPLTYQGSDEQYAALGRGLAEMVTVDLSRVDELRLVERTRLQALLDEIELAQGDQFDPATAPRVGRLVGAGRLVGGVYNVLADGNLRLDANLWENDGVQSLDPQSDALRNFFQLEKRLVFDLIDEMGIELTQEERLAIEFTPTQNLQAFLAFSRGLEREDAGAFGEAAGFFEQAVQLDPNFREARARADESQGQAVASGALTTALAAAFTQDPTPPLPSGPAVDAMVNLLQVLNLNVGSYLVPGQDAREPAVETGVTNGGNGGGGGDDTLPDPPPPPPRGN